MYKYCILASENLESLSNRLAVYDLFWLCFDLCHCHYATHFCVWLGSILAIVILALSTMISWLFCGSDDDSYTMLNADRGPLDSDDHSNVLDRPIVHNLYHQHSSQQSHPILNSIELTDDLSRSFE